MKLVIVGGVAGGASAAARARRLDEHARIILFERGDYVSFANCGLPYYLGGEIGDREKLLVSTPEKLEARYNIQVRTMTEVTEIDRRHKTVTARNLATGEQSLETYDKLILSPGAAPIRPSLPGADLDTVFTLRNIPDADRIMKRLEENGVKRAVVIGGGFIGLEMVENLVRRGVSTVIIEMQDQVLPPLDFEMAAMVHSHLREKGVELRCREGVEAFKKKGERTVVVTESGTEIDCDIAFLSIGVRPESELAERAGLEVGDRGGIVTDDRMRTSDPDIFAVGDAVLVREFVSGQKELIPLAGPANRQGRIAADNAMGRDSRFRGTQGTSVVRIFDLVAATTGLCEKSLNRAGVPCRVSFTHSYDHASYYPESERMAVKLIFSPGDGRILGAQVVGKAGVDKRIDVIAMAIQGRMSVFDLEEAELAYSPPFGSAKDPVNMAGFVASNILRGDVEAMTWDRIETLDPDTHRLLDVRDQDEIEETGMIGNALHIPLEQLRDRKGELDREKTYVIYCTISLRAYIAARILVQQGFKALILSGGMETYNPPAEERKLWKAGSEEKGG